MKVKMTLEKAASKSGGDKYAGKIENEDFSIYLPQCVSRPKGGSPKKVANITIEMED